MSRDIGKAGGWSACSDVETACGDRGGDGRGDQPSRQMTGGYEVSESFVSRLVVRYRSRGRRCVAKPSVSSSPQHHPRASMTTLVEFITNLRVELTAQRSRCRSRYDPMAPRMTITASDGVGVHDPASYSVVASGLVSPEPKKRPKSSYMRFEAELPNECWQSDFTHWRLADRTDVEILVVARRPLPATPSQSPRTSPSLATIVVDTFNNNRSQTRVSASVLTDNGSCTPRSPGARGAPARDHLAALGHQNTPTEPPDHLRKGRRFHQTERMEELQPRVPTDHSTRHPRRRYQRLPKTAHRHSQTHYRSARPRRHHRHRLLRRAGQMHTHRLGRPSRHLRHRPRTTRHPVINTTPANLRHLTLNPTTTNPKNDQGPNPTWVRPLPMSATSQSGEGGIRTHGEIAPTPP